MNNESKMMPEFKRKRFEHAQFRLVGNHSAVKICYWCKNKIRGKSGCYKESFYGVDTDKCLEMSPAITCNQRCIYCWRDTSIFAKEWKGKIDEPEFIISESIKARAQLLTGFKAIIDKNYFDEIIQPNHAAISLTGEPCMYPKLAELINAFFKRKFKTVFLVTSGTVPEMLANLKKKPTNLYISLDSINEKQYMEICKPVIKNGWQKLNESLDLMRKMKGTRKILRITLIKGLNDFNASGFIPLIEKAKPDFIEVKAFMNVGYARQRLKDENMPLHEEIRAFAKNLEESTNYRFNDERIDSRVVQLKKSN